MKKKRLLLAVATMVTLIILLVTGFTVSRYSQTITGGFDFQVAPWVFNVTTNGGRALSEIELTTPDGRQPQPGTNGSFDIIMDATNSGISLSYVTTLVKADVPNNMKFYLSETPDEQYSDFNEIVQSLKGNLDVGGVQKDEYHICWTWPKDGTDDIAVATSNKEYGISLSVTATQV